jgi:predicted nucleic acid-binding protein
MTNKIFVDTNILVYAYDRSEHEKQIRALAVLNHLTEARAGVISAQVMSEFFSAATRRIQIPLSKTDAYQRLENNQQSWEVVPVTPEIVLEGVRGVREYQFSLWDGQIWAAARLNQITIVFSEDFNVGSVIEGVRFVNPLIDNFQIGEWVI